MFWDCHIPWAIPEKNKQGVWGYNFLKTPWKFYICDFTFGNSGENKLSPLEIQQNCVTLLGNSKVKNQDPCHGNSTLDFTWTPPGNSASFLIDPPEFPHFLSSIPLEISCPQPLPCLVCFWNSPLLHYWEERTRLQNTEWYTDDFFSKNTKFTVGLFSKYQYWNFFSASQVQVYVCISR